MATTEKAMANKIARLEEALKRTREREKKRRAAAAARSTRRVYNEATWKGPAPAPLGVYYIRVMLDEKQVGGFGPYATVRAAAADAKNILRMHIGPGRKIVETGPVVPVIRSDKKIRLYLHPESYSAQLPGKGVISAQVIEIDPPESRLDTFPMTYNPRRNGVAKPRLHAGSRAGFYVVSTKTGNILSGPWASEASARSGPYGTRSGTEVVYHQGPASHNPRRRR